MLPAGCCPGGFCLCPQENQHGAAGAQRAQRPHGAGGQGELGEGAVGLGGTSGGAHRPSLCPQFLFVSLRRREATYQLLRSLCRHLQVGAVLGGGRALCPPHPSAALLVQDNTWSPPASPLNNSTKQSPRKSLVRERQQQQHSVAPGRAFWGKRGAEKSRPPCQTPTHPPYKDPCPPADLEPLRPGAVHTGA